MTAATGLPDSRSLKYTADPLKAIAKTKAAPGLDLIDVPEPPLRPGCVKVRIEKGSVCGTDLHIYRWDHWAESRIGPPIIVGHEFCGTIVEVAPDVADRAVGDFVASESHIVCGKCLQCRNGQGHVCVNTRILGVDVDGGFAPYAVLPANNARPTSPSVPKAVASLQDALGNAVHTVMAGSVEGQTILITGLGPIGLFAVGVCRALGAERVITTEISPFRKRLGERMGADLILDPSVDDVSARLAEVAPLGVDATLEMSGVPSSIELAMRHTRPGGRISLLGLFAESMQSLDLNALIFRGLDVQGIVGRRLWETWEQMHWLLTEKGLDVSPVITHEMPYTEIERAMEVLEAGQAGKVVLDFSGA